MSSVNAKKTDDGGEENRREMLLTGEISRIIPRLAAPTIISMMITAIYNMADTFFVSQIGTSASGAVGVIFSAMAIIQALSFTIGMGSGNYMARRLGAGQQKEGETIASTAFFTGLILGTCLGLVCLFFIEPIVMLLGATETIRPYAVQYAQYIFLATPFMMCSFIMNNLLRLQGLAAVAMIGITSGGILNIILDPIFIFGLGMGISGAAIATGLSQVVSFTILLFESNRRKECISMRLRNFKPSLHFYGIMLNGGLPSLGRQGMASIATIVLNTMAHPYGDAAIAAMAIVNRLTYFVNSAVIGVGQGFQPVCGFSYGAKEYERVRQAYWFCVKVTTVILVLVGVAGFLVSGSLIALFRRDDAEVIAIGTLALRLQLATIWSFGFYTMSSMMTQSIGFGVRATLIAMARQGLFLIPILLIATPSLGLLGIQAAQPISDILSVVLSACVVRGVFRQFALLAEERDCSGNA